jgi:hypothetical protein
MEELGQSPNLQCLRSVGLQSDKVLTPERRTCHGPYRNTVRLWFSTPLILHNQGKETLVMSFHTGHLSPRLMIVTYQSAYPSLRRGR